MTGAGPSGIEGKASFQDTEGDRHVGKEGAVFFVVTMADDARIGIDAGRMSTAMTVTAPTAEATFISATMADTGWRRLP